MKKEIRIEGSPFTRRRREWVRYEMENEDDMPAFADRMERMVEWSKDPWGAQRPLIEWATKQLAIERGKVSASHRFRAREDTAWYFEELLDFARIAEINITKGDASWAAFVGAKFGELWSELQLKLAREELFLVGKKATEGWAAGGAKTRRTADAVRVARWRDYFDQTGKKTEADRLAAEELGEGESTIRKARLAWGKAAPASD